MSSHAHDILNLFLISCQKIEGISLSSWVASTAVIISFRQAVVSCVNNIISYNNVDVTNVVSASDSAAFPSVTVELQQQEDHHFRAESTTAVVVTYHLIQFVHTYTAANVSALLEYSIANGYFTVYLQSYGNLNGAYALSSAYSTAEDFQFITTSAPTPAPTDSPHSAMAAINGGEIAAIIVGVILGYLLVVMVWRYGRRLAHEKKDPDYESTPQAL